MSWVDVIDGLNDFMPRRWKRRVGAGFACLFLVWPSGAQRAVLWYANEKAQQISQTVVDLMTPTPLPGDPAEPWSPSGAREHQSMSDSEPRKAR